MSASKLSDETAAMLTPEEREAIEEGEFTDAELKALQTIAGDDAGPAGSGDGDDSDDDSADDEGAGAPIEGEGADGKKAEGSPANAPPAAAQTQDRPAAEASHRYEAKLPDDFDARVAAIKEREAALKEKFKAGEMEVDEYEAERDKVAADREALTIARAKAEISAEMNTQSAEQQWAGTVRSFVVEAAAAQGGIDYRKDADKMTDLDGFVKLLAGNPANNDKSMRWFLDEAHRRVLALHDMPAPARAQAKPDPKAAADAKKAASEQRKPPVKEAPQTLATVPGGDGPGDVGDEFADIMSLDGMEFEAAVARMSPAQREKFASR
jgi:hypothetical protein